MLKDALINQLVQLKKVELHVHIEGTLTLDRYIFLAKKHNISKNEMDSISLKRANYCFSDLSTFLYLYYASMNVLIDEDDFFVLTYDYLELAHKQNIIYLEIFFDPQAHLVRGITFETIITGIYRAISLGKSNLGISCNIIMCFLRDRNESEAMEILLSSIKYKDKIVGIGLDSNEKNNPPWKFYDVFMKAREFGYYLTCHCDVNQENSVEHIRYCVDEIKVDRLDHALNCLEDIDLSDKIAKKGLGLTVCPISNYFVVGNLTISELKDICSRGIKATINSDDPAFFGGDLLQNCIKLVESNSFSVDDIRKFMINAAEVSWLENDLRDLLIYQVTNIS